MSEHDLVREWLEIALEDVESAEYLFGKPHRKPLEIICYLCQQSAEKSLKGYLQARGEEVPRTHEVGLLCELCAELEPAFSAHFDACNDLALYATRMRYPNRMDVEEHHAARAIRWAKEIYGLAVKLCEAL